MDISSSQITYHSRRRDNQGFIAQLPLKQKQQYQSQNLQSYQTTNINLNPSSNLSQYPTSISYSYQTQSIQQSKSQLNNNNIPSFAYLHNHNQSSNPILPVSFNRSSQKIQQKTQYHPINQSKQAYQPVKLQFQTKQQQRQASMHQQQVRNLKQQIRKLKLHLKSSIQVQNESQQKYNILRQKIQQKQSNHINQMSILKADLIILQKQYQQSKELLNRKDLLIKQLQQKIMKNQQGQYKLRQSLMRQKMQTEQIKTLLVEERMVKQKNQRLNKIIDDKSMQIQNIKKQRDQLKVQFINLQSQIRHFQQQKIPHYQRQIQQLKHQISHIKQINSQLQQNFNELQKQNLLTCKKNQQLNLYVKQVCRNSQHLYQQIREYKTKHDIMNEKLDTKQQQKQQAQQKFNMLLENIQSYQSKCQELKESHDIVQEQYRLLTNKYQLLQENNLQIERSNTELLKQMHLMQEEIKELKGLCVQQQRKQTELNDIIDGLQTEIDKISILKNQQTSLNNRHNIEPTRDIQKRFKTESYATNDEQRMFDDRSNYYEQTKQSFMKIDPNKQRFNYLSNKTTQNNHTDYQKKSYNMPYSQFLSFQPSKPYNSTKSYQNDDNRRRVYTSVDDVEHIDNIYPQKMNQRLNKSYHNDSNSQKDEKTLKRRRNQSLYVQKNQKHSLAPTVYKSQHHFRNHQQITTNSMINLSNIRNARPSLELKRDLSGMVNPKSSLNSNSYQNQHSYYHPILEMVPEEQKKNIIDKLDKIKMWTRQATSQSTTQRQASQSLAQYNTNNMDYLKRQSSIQQIIKQKSKGVLQQRKNLFNLNLNNHMIQKNMLKLQKNTCHHNLLSTKPQSLNSRDYFAKNNVQGLSPIQENILSGKRNKQNNLNFQVYKSCKKTLYGN